MLFAVFIMTYLSACSTSNNAIYHNKFNFDAVESYSIYHRNSHFTDTQSLSDTRRNSIEITIEKHMEQAGFIYLPPKSSDIIITYHLVNKDSDFKRYNKAVLFCQQCIQASNWLKGSDKLTIFKSSLVIDLVDPKRKRSVWRSIQPLKIDDKDNSQEVNEKIYQAVHNMLVQYPR